jgi:hypothetical protein
LVAMHVLDPAEIAVMLQSRGCLRRQCCISRRRVVHYDEKTTVTAAETFCRKTMVA